MALTPAPARDLSRSDEPAWRASAVGGPLSWACLASSWVIILAGLALTALFILAGMQTVGLAWPVTHPEGATIAAILRIRDGQPLYQDFQQFPHVITPYPPLQPVVS